MRRSSSRLVPGTAGAAAELHAFSSEFNGNELGPPYVWLSPQNLEVQLAGPPHLHETGVILVTRGGESRTMLMKEPFGAASYRAPVGSEVTGESFRSCPIPN